MKAISEAVAANVVVVVIVVATVLTNPEHGSLVEHGSAPTEMNAVIQDCGIGLEDHVSR